MCDFSRKLMAWLDGELPANEAGDVERHVQLCPQCRARLESYRQVSGAFKEYCDCYCDVVTASAPRRKSSRRVLAIWEAAGLTAAAVVVLFLLAARARVHLSSVGVPAPTAGMVIAPPSIQTGPAPKAASAPAPVKMLSGKRRTAPQQTGRAASQQQAQAQDANWLPAEPAVEIAIPGDAIFPPGALPEGVGFTADVTIAPDGSARQIRLRPQLTEFERRPTRP